MKNKKSQSGSAHAIIVIILVIALLGSLGFIFWQNFVQSKNTPDQNKNNQTINKSTENSAKTNVSNEIALTESITDNTVGTGLTLKYPSNWLLSDFKSYNQDGLRSEQYNITSPSGDIKIHYLLGNGGVGGTCEKLSGDEIIQINAEEMPTYPDARFVTYYGKDYYAAVVQPNTASVKSVKVGDSGCDFGISGILSPIKNNYSINNVSLSLTIELPKIGYKGASSVEKFKELIKTDDFKTAKSIVESLYVKQ